MNAPFFSGTRKYWRPYFTLSSEAMRLQRENRHETWRNEDCRSTRRMLRFAIWWCVWIVAMIAVACLKTWGGTAPALILALTLAAGLLFWMYTDRK